MKKTFVRDMILMFLLMFIGGFVIFMMFGCTPTPEPIPLTNTPQPTATATPLPTATLEPTPQPTIPPLGEMCWSENALVSFFETDEILSELVIELEDVVPVTAKYPEWANREWIDSTDFDNRKEIWLRSEDRCIEELQFVSRTNTDTELGDWGLTGTFHGFMTMMTEIDYLFFVEDAFLKCTNLEVDVEAEHSIEEGYYNEYEFRCRWKTLEDGNEYLILSTQIRHGEK